MKTSTGTLIRQAREHAGLTRPELCKMAPINYHTLSSIETGRRDISMERLRLVAKALKVSVRKLVSD